MQNRYMKASIISSSIAILTGVLFFGISVTLGAPTYGPSRSESVKPTFSGLNVNGAVKISETNIAAFPNNQVLADATGGLLVLKNDPVNAPKKGIFMDGDDIVSLGQQLSLNAFGGQQISIGSKDTPANLDIPGGYIRNSNNGGADPVTILGVKLPGPGDLDVASSSSIKNSSVGFPVKISDPDGLSLSAGNLDMQNGVIKNSTANNSGNVKIDDTIDVTGALATDNIKSYSGGTVKVNGDSTFTGDVDVQGILGNSLGTLEIGGDLQLDQGLSVEDTLTVNPNGAIDKPITLNGSTLVKYALTAGGWLDVKTGIQSSTGSVVIDDVDGVKVANGDIDLQNGAIKNSTANNFGLVNIQDHTVINGDLGVSGQISSNKKITSSVGFGTYTFRQSGFVLIPKGGANHAYVTLACNAGEVAVSCFSNAFSSNAGTDFWTNETYDDVILTALYPWTTKCEANYKNTSALADKYIKVGVMCLDPTK